MAMVAVAVAEMKDLKVGWAVNEVRSILVTSGAVAVAEMKDLKFRHIFLVQGLLSDAIDLLPSEDAGLIQTESQLERTWRLSQNDIVEQARGEAARGRIAIKLDGGPYRVRYTKNGRHMAIAGRTGHVASFDTLTGAVHNELQLGETCRDVIFLQDHSFYAVAQQKYAFIYDRDGVEIHKLKAHISPSRLEFLPYHWLLASVGSAGYLKYQDTSTGQLVAEHRTALGACSVLTQNPHNAVLYLGHQNGCVTLVGDKRLDVMIGKLIILALLA
ncbi:hypothetical protein BT96DRAFT_946012 [Gymnopus androsaceus JB14]|uniref:Uncharacterized protein n=1 Tax=Gymnopus androsaceus JB14 TaxID=1447944 RepID=A0A6A4GXT9_9AGAR|nr:hypothetical protein BT96DRAFT_946012 [Gymnopus androsaceus JB14]